MSHFMSPTISRRQFLQITAAAGLTLGVGYLSRTLRAHPTTIQETRILMGTIINLALVTEDKQEGERVVAAALARLGRAGAASPEVLVGRVQIDPRLLQAMAE